MSTNPKESPEALLASLKQDVEDHEYLEKLEAMSDAELEADLAKDGITAEKRAELAALVRPANEPGGAKVTPSNVVDIRSARRWRPAMTVGGGALMLVAAVVLVFFGLSRTGNLPEAFYPPKPKPSEFLAATGSPPTAAQLWRDHAKVACEDHQYEMCLYLLDKAKATDPDGDALSEVAAMRTQATEALTQSRDR